MMREATAACAAGAKSPKAARPKASGPALRMLTDNKARRFPYRTPRKTSNSPTARSSSAVRPASAMAEFYRSTMKQQGWESRSSVINNANMVVLNFAKAGKSVSFTIMRMGNKTNVTAEGSALEIAAAKPAAVPARPPPCKPATAEDLEAEESGGLPMPKRHTMSEGTKTPFRRELKASVPLELTDVLGFYRRELGKLNWKEEPKGTRSPRITRPSRSRPRGSGEPQARPQGWRDHREPRR